MSVVICFIAYLTYKLVDRLIGVLEYKTHHTKRESRYEW